MSNLAIDTAIKASNFLNLINIHSKNVYDNIINSDLNGTIIAGSPNVWNIFDGWVFLQNNKHNTWYLYYYNNPSYDKYVDKSSVSSNAVGIRVLIKYRE